MKRFVIASLLGATLALATPGVASASHGDPEDYGVPLFERIAASPDWEDYTGLVRGTLFMLSDLVEALKHGFGLWDHTPSPTPSPSLVVPMSGAGSNVSRSAVTRPELHPPASPATTGGAAPAGYSR